MGPVKDFKDLSPEKREALGDMDSIVSTPAPLDPRVVAAEQAAEEAPVAPVVKETEPDPSAETARLGADEMEALRAVLNRSELDEEVEDPEVLALEADAAPTTADKQNFMRCLFGDKPYTKEYHLFGGMLVVEMTDISPTREDAIFIQLSRDQKEGIVKTQDDWDIALDRYRMVCNIQKVIWSGQEIMLSGDGEDLPTEVKVRLLDGVKNSVVYRALLRVTRVFRRHLEFMLERAMDSDFWQVDGPSSLQEPTPVEPSTSEDTTDQPAGA